MNLSLVVVKLDNADRAADGGRVVACVATVAEYFRLVTDRDGAIDRSFRLWQGFPSVKVGDLVRLPTRTEQAQLHGPGF
jgi:hypothetical protein